MDQRLDTVKKQLEAAGQSHVLKYYDTLSVQEQGQLLNQLENIKEMTKLKDLLQKALQDQDKVSSSQEDKAALIEPFQGKVARDPSSQDVARWRTVGLEAIANKQVAALVLAGGQGTRLGFDGPKGMYNMGLPSQKTLFALIAQRIQRLQILSTASGNDPKNTLPLYIMTSPLNHDTTVEYFAQNQNFGIDVHFFPQGMLPCLYPDGTMILETASKVAMAPDGNGGIYPSLQASGTLKHMKETGIKYIHAFAIDNSLVKPADPVFCGYCIAENADCGNKVVWKSSPHEKVGVLAQKEGKPCIVEYSDISTEMAERVMDNDKSTLVFGAGNICNHFYTLDFIESKVLTQMDNLYHVARKKIPYWNGKETIKPESNNGIKLESFIFDVFPLSESMAVMDVARHEEFAPVKNAPGSASDSPDTAREMLSARSKAWMIAAGAKLVDAEEGAPICEISPLTSYDGEGLEEYNDKEVKCPFNI